MSPSRVYRLAFVTPRFPEPGFAGGAETLTAQLAHRLLERGHEVEFLTTCARDHVTWRNEHPVGRLKVDAMPVHRFAVDESRDLGRYLQLDRRMQLQQGLSEEDEREWVRCSVHSEGLYRHLERTPRAWDAVVFAPYLFGLSLEGGRRLLEAGGNTVLLPCLHDETFARLRSVRASFEHARGCLFNAHAEQRLAERLYALPPERGQVVGMGFEPRTGDGARFRQLFGVQDPFLLYAGRREGGKNTPLLIDYFRAWKLRHPGNPLKLVLMGSGAVEIPQEMAEEVIDLGFLSEQEKLDAMAACALFCHPSVMESFSIVLMETWMVGRPVLVHAKCEVAVDHCRRGGGGLFFQDFPEFEAAVEMLLEEPELAAQLGCAGNAYVGLQYRWDAVLDRFEAGLARFLS